MHPLHNIQTNPAQPSVIDYQGIRVGITENAEAGYAIAFTGCMAHRGEHGYILISAVDPMNPSSDEITWHIVRKESYTGAGSVYARQNEAERAARYAELSRKRGQPFDLAMSRVIEEMQSDCRRAESPAPDLAQTRAQAASRAAAAALSHITANRNSNRNPNSKERK